MHPPESRAGDEDARARRPAFRRRLLATVGPALAAALAVLALVAWGAAYLIVHHNAIAVLDGEVGEMQADAWAGGQLDLSRYAWDEAHHRLAVDRVDPIFVQVFAPDGRLVRQSANIDSLAGAYPNRLLERHADDGPVPVLHTFSAGGRTFYYRVRPLRREGDTGVGTGAGTGAGYVQVARAVPEARGMLWTFGAGLVGAWGLLSAGLMGLVGWAAGRVLRPLRAITRAARSVTSEELDTRVPVPEETDRETEVLGRALNGLLDRVEAHVGALRAFTANAAHELQTPLTVLRGHVEIALRRERDPESYRDTLRLLDRKLGELVRTLRALLRLTRLDRDGTLEREPVDLAALAREEAAAFEEPAREKGLAFEVSANGAAWVQGQPDLLREAVRNLVDNAVKYTEAGRVELAVEAEATGDAGGGRVRLACRDTGIGMTDKELGQATRRFFRGAGAGQTGAEGSGLGLALVRRIAEEHGGSIGAASTPGEGTRFTLVLPAAEAPDADASPDTLKVSDSDESL
jgi:signal transduction histidine kinase